MDVVAPGPWLDYTLLRGQNRRFHPGRGRKHPPTSEPCHRGRLEPARLGSLPVGLQQPAVVRLAFHLQNPAVPEACDPCSPRSGPPLDAFAGGIHSTVPL